MTRQTELQTGLNKLLKGKTPEEILRLTAHLSDLVETKVANGKGTAVDKKAILTARIAMENFKQSKTGE